MTNTPQETEQQYAIGHALLQKIANFVSHPKTIGPTQDAIAIADGVRNLPSVTVAEEPEQKLESVPEG